VVPSFHVHHRQDFAMSDAAPAALPSIAFAIPFRSGRDYLRRTIASVVAQRDPEWRAFVCDNASEEPGIAELVREVGGGQVGYVRNERDLGMVGNFNRCLDLADADLVTLVHSDDELAPDYTSTMRALAARHPHAVACYCRVVPIGADGARLFSLANSVKDRIDPAKRGEHVLAGELGFSHLARGNFITAPTLCFRKTILGARRFRADYRFVLDWELTTQLLLDGDELVGIPARCYRYRRHDASTTEQLTRTHERFVEEAAFYDRLGAAARARGWDRAARIAARRRLLRLNIASRALASAARARVGEVRTWVAMLREITKPSSERGG
jgi:glycosyltransferase involved in cell wall biosynthesis